MFWILFGAAALVEVHADMAVLLLTGPVDPLQTLRILEGRYEEALLHRKRDCGKEREVDEVRTTDESRLATLTPAPLSWLQPTSSYPPLSGEMTQFIICSTIATNAALNRLKLSYDNIIDEPCLSEHGRSGTTRRQVEWTAEVAVMPLALQALTRLEVEVGALVQIQVRGDSGETTLDGKVDGREFGGVVGEVRLDAGFGLRCRLLIRHENVLEGRG
jgi:hypothetical protein